MPNSAGRRPSPRSARGPLIGDRIAAYLNGRPQPRGRRRNTRLPLADSVGRIRIVLLALAILISLCAGRALQVQAFDPDAYADEAARAITQSQVLPAMRGQFTDRTGQILATTVPAVSIIADPVMIATNGRKSDQMKPSDIEFAKNAPGQIAAILAKHIGGTPEQYLAALTKPNLRYSIVAKGVPSITYEEIRKDISEGNLIGIYREVHPLRTYPGKTLAANVLGFVNADGVGSGGLEYSLNSQLAGTAGREIYTNSPDGRIPLGYSVVTPAVNGINYQLTLDAELQWMAERRIADTVAQTRAKSGTLIVLNVKTGEILAMANAPTFDPNNPSAAKPAALGNNAITNAYEPGSVEKVLTMAALADAGLVTADTHVEVPGRIASDGGSIKDAWPHDTLYLTARGVVAYSSNIGTLKLARSIGKDKLLDYLKSFGLGAKTGLPLPGEGAGQLPPASMRDGVKDQIAFGQGLSVTAIQEAAAIAGIVNGGVYNPPSLIKSATDGAGNPVAIAKPQPRRIISPEASATVRDMMQAVVTSAAAHKIFPIENFRTGAKSGTAEKFQQSCHCYSGYVTSFIGTGPIEDPQLLTYVVLDEPAEGQHHGSISASPAYRDIMRIALPRYGVKPSDGPDIEREITYA